MPFRRRPSNDPSSGSRTTSISFRACIAAGLCLALAGCASVARIPYTEQEARSSTVLGLRDLRRYADDPLSRFADTPLAGPRVSYLALSGGGADGAYGVGVLNGWTATGNRPSFSIVSGVSTGGLIAPFAFLGPAYDGVLREVYTSGIAESLLDDSNLLRAVFGAGLAGNTRLRSLVCRYVDADVLREIAREHPKGRRLYIVTTDLDTQRTAIWDMGRIASVATPAALELAQDVMTASASLPLIFPPMLIQAEAGGKHVQEMHVDGGVNAPILTLPDQYLLRRQSPARNAQVDMYLLVNNKIEPEFTLVRNSSLDVASRSISSVTKSQTRSIIFSTYEFAKQNGLSFALSYIERDYPSNKRSEFDTAYMQNLYDFGFNKAATGSAWRHSLPMGDDAVAGLH